MSKLIASVWMGIVMLMPAFARADSVEENQVTFAEFKLDYGNQYKQDIVQFAVDTDAELTRVTDFLKNDFAKYKAKNKSLQSFQSLIDLTGRQPDSDDDRPDYKKLQRELESQGIKNILPDPKSVDGLREKFDKQSVAEVVKSKKSRVVLTLVRGTANSLICSWGLSVTMGVPMLHTLPVGAVMGGLSGLMMYNNAWVQKNMILKSYILSWFGVDMKTYDETQTKLESFKKGELELNEEQSKSIKRVARAQKILVKAEEFLKSYGMETVFTMTQYAAIVGFGLDAGGEISNNMLHYAGEAARISSYTFAFQTFWDAAFAEEAKQKIAKANLTGDRSLAARIQRMVDTKVALVSILSVGSLTAFMTNVPYTEVVVGTLAGLGALTYAKVNFNFTAKKFFNKCSTMFKNWFTQIKPSPVIEDHRGPGLRITPVA